MWGTQAPPQWEKGGPLAGLADPQHLRRGPGDLQIWLLS